MPVYKRKLERRRNHRRYGCGNYNRLFHQRVKTRPPGRGLKQLPRWWRIVIPAATPPVISSNVPISFYIRAWGIACALTWLDFLSTTSSAGEEWREHSGCWRIQQRCVPSLRECSKGCAPSDWGWGSGKHEHKRTAVCMII